MSTSPFCNNCAATVEQACAVPYRGQGSRRKFCLITSTRGRWLFPKGCIDPGTTPQDTALKEAYEEAGLHGRIVDPPLGCYGCDKNGQRLNVVAMLMKVERCDTSWPEEDARQRRWVSAAEVAEAVTDPELLEIFSAAIDRIAAA